MERFTGPQRAFCVRAFYKNNDSYVLVRRLYRNHFNIARMRDVPSENLIKYCIRKFENSGNTMTSKPLGRPRSARSNENIERVRQFVNEDPRQSLRLRAASLILHKSTVHRIIRKDMHFHPYKIVITQELKPQDPANRSEFCRIMREDFNGCNNIWFSDESNFHINGHVNKQNCRYWAEQNPQNLYETPLHSPKVIVWAAMSRQGIIGPYFFKDNLGQAQTVTSERYCHMIKTFLSPAIQNHGGYNRNTFFQQDGATPHVTNASLDALDQLFPGRIISRRGDINWPPRSPDLTPADFFLWGHLKCKVYTQPPQDLRELKQKIPDEINAVPRAMLQRVIENFGSRLRECENMNGAHLSNTLFHK